MPLPLVMLTVLTLLAAAATATVPRHPDACGPGQATQCGRLMDSIAGGVANHNAPAIAAAAFTTATGAKPKALHFAGAAGRYKYDQTSAEATTETQYDMASCSKIMATTTATAQLYQRGYLSLDTRVADPALLGPGFAAQGKGSITVRNLMLHNAGYPPDPSPGYWQPAFPCRENTMYHPAQRLSCEATIYEHLLANQTLVYPTGSRFIYSDLSMITQMFVIGAVVRRHALASSAYYTGECAGRYTSLVCTFNAYVAEHVFARYGLTDTQYVPSDPSRTAPEWVDTTYHHGLVMGFVSDQNAFALGGIAGHAGVFSTARDAARFMRVWMEASDEAWLNRDTVTLFTTVANLTQSSRALGWDTNAQPSPPCGSLSARTFFHIGFTGTQFCGDPALGVATVLLGNGRHPNYHVDGMIPLRPAFNSLVRSLV